MGNVYCDALSCYQQAVLAECCDDYLRECETQEICKCAKKWRKKLLNKLMCEACKPGGEITRLGTMQKSRADHLEALRQLIDWTYSLCRRAAQEQGPALVMQTTQPCPADPCHNHHYPHRLHSGCCYGLPYGYH